MTPTRQGSFHLFRFAGIDLYLHWSWFLVAAFEVSSRGAHYSSLVWNGLEYLSLFLIVMLHEFGHALACRQVGGKADQIVLWPLGGVAYVAPPPRPGATLWSIAAGPLVNVALLPLLTLGVMLARSWGLPETMPNAFTLLRAVWFINLALLIFNLLPVYPLDGGQILRSLLWFVMGRARSLLVASVVGLVGAAGLVAFALYLQSIWIGILCLFILVNCWNGFQQARVLTRFAKLPRREGYACPGCHAAPPLGPLWVCGNCEKPFDTFLNGAVCPECGARFGAAMCMECGDTHPMPQWNVTPG
ncbi:MAG TPA: site-2 protease family protein [Verrucomicrobiae bacterium]|nr:site-2 protease family protein [Verrucomicrobiae bacterium]